MVISILFKIGIVKILKFLHTVLIDKKQIFQMKILDEINFFIIIILIQLILVIYSPCYRKKFLWSTDIQDALPLV